MKIKSWLIELEPELDFPVKQITKGHMDNFNLSRKKVCRKGMDT